MQRRILIYSSSSRLAVEGVSNSSIHAAPTEGLAVCTVNFKNLENQGIVAEGADTRLSHGIVRTRKCERVSLC